MFPNFKLDQRLWERNYIYFKGTGEEKSFVSTRFFAILKCGNQNFPIIVSSFFPKICFKNREIPDVLYLVYFYVHFREQKKSLSFYLACIESSVVDPQIFVTDPVPRIQKPDLRIGIREVNLLPIRLDPDPTWTFLWQLETRTKLLNLW